jgi:hypothetical protein
MVTNMITHAYPPSNLSYQLSPSTTFNRVINIAASLNSLQNHRHGKEMRVDNADIESAFLKEITGIHTGAEKQ